MKKGDVVTISDGSFTRSVIDGKLSGELLNCGGAKGKRYVVIETGCSFPNSGNRGFCEPFKQPTFNNTVIQAIDSGKVVFIEERFLRPVLPKHKVMIDIRTGGGLVTGQYVEISHELYQEIKREAQ